MHLCGWAKCKPAVPHVCKKNNILFDIVIGHYRQQRTVMLILTLRLTTGVLIQDETAMFDRLGRFFIAELWRYFELG
jgi:hypothetical protein